MAKPDWRRKLKDPDILAKWSEEAKVEGLRQEVFEYAINELSWHAESFDPVTGIGSSGVDLDWVSIRSISLQHIVCSTNSHSAI